MDYSAVLEYGVDVVWVFDKCHGVLWCLFFGWVLGVYGISVGISLMPDYIVIPLAIVWVCGSVGWYV